MTIFVAACEPPEVGLQGTLGIALTPKVNGLGDVSILTILEVDYDHPTTYVVFYTEEYKSNTGLYRGYVSFTNELEDSTGLTPAGQFEIAH